jgi:hypothetical protein
MARQLWSGTFAPWSCRSPKWTEWRWPYFSQLLRVKRSMRATRDNHDGFGEIGHDGHRPRHVTRRGVPSRRWARDSRAQPHLTPALLTRPSTVDYRHRFTLVGKEPATRPWSWSPATKRRPRLPWCKPEMASGRAGDHAGRDHGQASFDRGTDISTPTRSPTTVQ